jgi:hypothetical protein
VCVPAATLRCRLLWMIDWIGKSFFLPDQTASMDQLDRLLLVTVTPLGALLGMWLVHASLPSVVRCVSPTSVDQASAAARVAKYRLLIYQGALVLLFTIYPGLSTEVVKTFRYGKYAMCTAQHWEAPAKATCTELVADPQNCAHELV